jgi:hypothetical protein
MFAYRGVLHAGKYYGKKSVLNNEIKMTKIKISQNKNKARVNYFYLQRLEKKLKNLIEERNSPFLL